VTYSQPFIKIKAQGHFGSSGTDKKEVWSAGLNIANPAGSTAGSSTLLTFLGAISGPFGTWHALTSAKVGGTCYLDTLTAALIDKSGHYAGGSSQSTTVYTYAVPVVGAGTSTAPWSQAMAWSLRSAILRGPGSHGRCFYPALGAGVDPQTGVLTPATVTAYSAGVMTLINAINVAASAAFGANTNVSCVSPIGLGYQSPVTRVGIGARLDTQESRESKTSEAYLFANTTIARAVLEQAERDYLDYLKTLPDFQDKD
jgi:hypothetical protein